MTHLLTETTNIVELTFLRLLDLHSPVHNKPLAKTFALENWSELSEKAKNHFDHVFGKNSRLHPENTVEETSPYLKKAIATMEDAHLNFIDPSAGTA